ncbi:AAA domain-containing protein [Catenulispora rubra]|uniref:AAA domain-containing protein n=1 Tax=Catenulispora rubra TaxID=280293 RepID=UPI0018924D2E
MWLRLFQQLHHLCARHEQDAGLLTGQRRMHPDIGELVSQTYYDGRLEHHTQDPETKRPDIKILHGLTTPAVLKDKPSSGSTCRGPVRTRSPRRARRPNTATRLRRALSDGSCMDCAATRTNQLTSRSCPHTRSRSATSSRS